MPKNIARADAKAIAQVDRFTPPSTLTDGQQIELAIGNKELLTTIDGSESLADLIARLKTAWEDSGFAEFDEVTPSGHDDANGDAVALDLTAATAGKPFIVTARMLDASGSEVSTNEKQTVSLQNTPTGGTFKLTVSAGGASEETAGIAYDATAAAVKTALTNLSFLDTADVAVTGGDLPGTDVVIEFKGRLANTNVPLVTADHTGLTGGDATLTIQEATKGVPSQNHQTKIEFRDSPTGGNFQLVVDGVITGDIAYNASAATVASAVEALPAFASGDISGSGGSLPGTAVTLTFAGTVAGQSFTVDLIETDLTGFSVSASVSTVQDGSAGKPTPTFLFGMEAVPDPDILGSGQELTTVSGFSDPTVDADQVVLGTNAYEYTESEVTQAGMPGVYPGPPTEGKYVKTAYTIWARPDTLAAGRTILSRGTDQDFTSGADLRLSADGSGKLTVEVARDDATSASGASKFSFSDSTAQPALEAGKQALIVLILDNTTQGAGKIKLSVSLSDQTEATPFSQTTLPSDSNLTGDFTSNSSAPLYIGGRDQGGYSGAVSEWDGHLDEFYIWRNDTTAGDTHADRIDDEAAVDAMFNGGSGARPGGGQNEQQKIAVAGSPTAGTFELTVTTPSGTETVTVDYDETTADLESKIEGLPNVGAGNVSVTASGALPGNDQTVEFINDLGETNLDPMVVDDFDLLVSLTTPTEGNAGTNEVQTIEVTGVSDKSDVHDGTFTLTFGGNTTAAIEYNATAADVENALEALASIDDVTVTDDGNSLPTGKLSVEFVGATNKETDVALMTTSASLDSGQVTVTLTEEPLTVETITESEGPAHWDTPDNWTQGRIPDSDDDVVLEDNDQAFRYGLRQRDTFTVATGSDFLTADNGVDFREDQIVRVSSDDTLPAGLSADTDYYVIDLDRRKGTFRLATSAGGSAVDITDTGTGTHTVRVSLNSLRHYANWTGDVGLPPEDADGEYYQYRETSLLIGLASDSGADQEVRIGFGAGAGSGLLRLALGPDKLLCDVFRTGGAEDGLRAVLLTGDHTANEVTVHDGSVGLAYFAGETMHVTALEASGGEVHLGRGLTYDAIVVSGALLTADLANNGELTISP